MSNRNSQANKQAARERMRAERERQAKKDKIRRQLIVGTSIVAVLGIAAGIGVAVTKMNAEDGSSASAAGWQSGPKKKKFVAPANTSGKNGTDIIIGEKNAKKTLEVFEDARCPVCATFEQSTGEQVRKEMEDGKYKLSFTIGTFIDNNVPGTGSKNALSALGAAVNVSPEAFLDYKKALFSLKNHPSEQDDAFGKDSRLIEIAQQVPALKNNASFKKALKNGTYDPWALKMSAKFQGVKDINGTPAFKLNGTKMLAPGNDPRTPITTPEAFDYAYKKADKK
ncbi:thioredoxin domain-containing protein [Streptomyces sp. NPDC001922]|uniref:thioredoxin domain-containing protein n=1 Tax=Streptomyces sp. NPDC001922 TaxID=3364624 RepID=UPI0036788264